MKPQLTARSSHELWTCPVCGAMMYSREKSRHERWHQVHGI